MSPRMPSTSSKLQISLIFRRTSAGMCTCFSFLVASTRRCRSSPCSLRFVAKIVRILHADSSSLNLPTRSVCSGWSYERLCLRKVRTLGASYTVHTSPFKGGHVLTRASPNLQARLAKSADARDGSVPSFPLIHASDVLVQHHCPMSMMSLNVIITHDLEPLHGLHACILPSANCHKCTWQCNNSIQRLLPGVQACAMQHETHT